MLTTGLAGASVSALAVAGSLASDTLPAGSVAFAVTAPAGMATVGVIVALPFSSAVASPILLPSLSNNSTLVPGSALTSTGVLVPALPVRSVLTTGLAGAVVSAFLIVCAGVYVTDEPSGKVTIAVPSSETLISRANRFTFLTSSETFSFSASVKLDKSITSVTVGAPEATVISVSGDLLPALSVAVTET